MEFLLGIGIGGVVVIAIVIAIVSFLVSLYRKSRAVTGNIGALYDAIKAADDAQMNTPKTLSGTEPVHKMKIDKDFPEMNLDVAKTFIANFLPEYFVALSTGNIESIKNDCSRQFCEKLVAMGTMKKTVFKDIKVHRVVVSDYRRDDREATIVFQAAVQYTTNRNTRLSQEKYSVSYSYYLDYGDEGENVSLRCKHCGAPISSVGVKVCPYCDSQIESSIVRTWKITDVKYSTY